MDTVLQDIRYALRSLRRNPGFTCVAVLTLGLGIGANSAVFSAVDAVLLRPLPFPDAERLVVLENTSARVSFFSRERPKRTPDLEDWRAQTDVFEQIAVYMPGGLNLSFGDRPVRIRAVRVTPNFFPTLGGRAALGRVFVEGDVQPGATDVVVLGDGLWRRAFGADAGVVGKTVTLNGLAYEIVGVMPRGFTYPQAADLWLPLPIPLDTRRYGDMFRIVLRRAVVARLRPGVTLAAAQARVAAVEEPYRATDPSADRRERVQVMPLRDDLVRGGHMALLVLMGAVGCVLLIACANISNLLLARATARGHEIALRSALGATRGRIARQLLTESGVLAVMGAVTGLLLAVWIQHALVPLVPQRLADLAPVRMDTRLLLFTLGAACVATVFFGVAPALDAARAEVTSSLKMGGFSGAGGRRGRLRGALLVTEAALATVLLVGAGLMLKSLWRLQATDTGIEAERVLTADIALPRVPYSDRARRAAFFRDLTQRLETIPGVRAAGAVNALPLAGGAVALTIEIAGRPPEPDMSFAQYVVVTPGYFRALGVPLVAGREFSEADDADAPPVAIINQTMARRFWPARSPLGTQIVLPGYSTHRTIVGVVGDVRQQVRDPAGSQVYLPSQQEPSDYMVLTVRAALDPVALVAAVERAVAEVDPSIPLHQVRTMTAVVEDSIAPERRRALLLGAFGALALTLAAVGIYGVTAYGAGQRTHEVGIRIALGAARRHVLWLVMRQSLRLTLLGIVIGAAGAWATARVLAHLLYTVSPHDLAVFGFGPVVLIAVATLGCYLPARRAARVDPMVALRTE
ncbi:MAG: ABC transporter permease [Gemmatimonadales bacterium]